MKEADTRRSTNGGNPPSTTVPIFMPAAVEALARIEGCPRPRVDLDAQWRRRPRPSRHTRSGIQLSRWKDERPGVRQHSTSGACDYITVDIALRYTELTLWVDDERVHEGRLKPGTALVTGAGLPTRAEFRGPCDVLHLFVPTALFAEIFQAADLGPARTPPQMIPAVPDQVIERLAWSLLQVEGLDSATAELYVDAITVAILVRLLNPNMHRAPGKYPDNDGLANWRLKRVLDFVDKNLAEPLSLEMLAACAGLSRMYFAAQFRAATGIRPHEYLIRRRVERAAELLRETTLPLVEVALDVGFQTQAHFTTVFRRLTGETPSRWRHHHRKEPISSNRTEAPAGFQRGDDGPGAMSTSWEAVPPDTPTTPIKTGCPKGWAT